MTERIKNDMESFDYGQKVRKLEDVIKVDDMVAGCPMNIDIFMQALTKYLKEFNLA
jgi:coenzyme F420-reducing hydrogenase gamma subunit